MSRSLKLVIFDCDGTLVDSQHRIAAAMAEAYRAHGRPVPDRAHLLSTVGLSLSDAFSVLAQGDPTFPVRSFVDRYRAAFWAQRQSGLDLEPLFPGARETVELLSARPDVILGIATGKSQRGARAVLRHHHLLDRFASIQTADDAPSKPHPGMVLEAMRATGTSPEATIVVGDTVYDIAMAEAALVASLGVGWGYHPTAMLREAGALMVLDDFAALIPALEGIWGCG
jgi:phosphoglycolate phosphatase